jgi:indolepyruvate ferredoxin oxidoreductase alpha subunit
VFDPSSPEEAFEMIGDAFEYSEKYKTPVLFRPTTRVCHAYAGIEVSEACGPAAAEGFIRDPGRWVIFPRLSYMNHGLMEKRNTEISRDFSSYRFNTLEGGPAEKAVIASGVSYAYVKELSDRLPGLRLIKVATAFPFPEDFMLEALNGVKEVLCFEELSPYIEEQVLKLAGRHGLSLKVHGKLDGSVAHNGENSVETAKKAVGAFLGARFTDDAPDVSDAPPLPVRPPVLCAGCPHRASFYAVKQAMKGQKAIYCGDIGCYTLGNAMPLDMVDTCLCMGAGVTMAQGFSHVEPGTKCFAFTGDSTFFASGMTGVVNAVYNEADVIICVLDNSTTAMTGHQPHPGTGRNMMGGIVEKADIARVLEGLGVKRIVTVDPLDLQASIAAVKDCAAQSGVKAIIFKSPCIALTKPDTKCVIGPECINCKKCIRETGCPALTTAGGKVTIDRALCTGCGLCGKVCPKGAVGGEGK